MMGYFTGEAKVDWTIFHEFTELKQQRSKKMKKEMRTFVTTIIKDGVEYEGPNIQASSWEEAEVKAKEAVRVIGELDRGQ